MTYNSILQSSNDSRNHELATCYGLSPESELYTAVLTMSLQDKFYETCNEQIERIARLVSLAKPDFVAKLAVYARNEMYLRSVPLLLVTELARIHKGDDLVSRTVDKVVQRPDEIMELLMCYEWRNPRPDKKKLGKLSHQIVVGLQSAFNRFDEYQFAKYDRSNLDVKLRDALFIVHPKAKDAAQQAIFDKIANSRLATPYTWETELSDFGQKEFDTYEDLHEAIAQKWTELIRSGRLGYMALMRNICNILEANVPFEVAESVARTLSDKRNVENSRQMPFRYLAAYHQIGYTYSPYSAMMLEALEKAVMHTASSIKGIDENSRVVLACDTSTSMYSHISMSTILCCDIGFILAMLVKSRCRKVVTGVFGDEWKVVNYPSTSILGNCKKLRSLLGEVGCGTHGEKPLQWLIDQKLVMDKVMIFTDCQFWDDSLDDYASMFKETWMAYKKIAPEARLYLFDLMGYGQMPLSVNEDDVYCIAGWSDRIFDVLYAIEHGESALEVINGIEI